MLSFLLSLSLGFGAIDLEQLPLQRVEKIATEVVRRLEGDLSSRPTVLIGQRQEATPLGAISYLNGRCVMIINHNSHAWAQWGRFLNAKNSDQWDDIIAASVAHEMGHCMKENRQYAVNQLNNETTRGLANIQGAAHQQDIVFKQELFADAVALIYAKEHMGDRADAVIESLVQSREKFSQDDPSHSTGQALRELMNTSLTRNANENLGSAAKRLLTQSTAVNTNLAMGH